MSEKPGKVKITVLKVFRPEEVFENPPVKTKAYASTPCPYHKVGQVFYFDDKDLSSPGGFCTYAWNAIWPFVMALSNRSDFQYYYDELGVAVIP